MSENSICDIEKNKPNAIQARYPGNALDGTMFGETK